MNKLSVPDFLDFFTWSVLYFALLFLTGLQTMQLHKHLTKESSQYWNTTTWWLPALRSSRNTALNKTLNNVVKRFDHTSSQSKQLPEPEVQFSSGLNVCRSLGLDCCLTHVQGKLRKQFHTNLECEAACFGEGSVPPQLVSLNDDS